MENVCRTCLKTPPELLSIYNDDSLIHKLETIAPVEVNDDDNLPATICIECITNINNFYNFRMAIVNSYKELKERHEIRNLELKKEQENNENLLQVETIEEKISIDDVKLQDPTENCRLEEEDYSDEKAVKIDDSVSGKEKRTFSKSTQIAIIRRLLSNKKVPPKKNLIQQLGNSEETSALEKQELNATAEVVIAEQATTSHTNSQLEIIRKMLNRCYKCPICDSTFSSHMKLVTHKRTEHKKTSMCNICGLVTRTDNLKKHISIHSAKPVKCEQCGKMYKNVISLKGHQLSHRGDCFVCDICGRSYNAKNKYNTHLKWHANPELRKKPFCNICNKNVSSMKNHMQKHTGERLYTCTCCNKGLTSNSALKVHMRQHTKEKPFQCNYCSMAFTQKPSLQTHLKSKHNAIL